MWEEVVFPFVILVAVGIAIAAAVVCVGQTDLLDREVSLGEYEHISRMQLQCPSLQPMVREAMADGKLIRHEYDAIVEAYPRALLEPHGVKGRNSRKTPT